jgi:Ca2+-dependent lipid-binding protein
MSIKLNIKSASNLIPVAADGTYSPFVIVYVGDMKDSKQQTPQASTLNPGWTHGNSMIFELKSGIRFEDVIHFEVKDFQSKFKGSNQIGYCQLPLWRILLNNGQEWRLSLKRDAVLSGFLTIETLLVNRAELKLLEQSARLMVSNFSISFSFFSETLRISCVLAQ